MKWKATEDMPWDVEEVTSHVIEKRALLAEESGDKNKFIKETDSGMNYNLDGLFGKPVYNFMNRSLQLSISES